MFNLLSHVFFFWQVVEGIYQIKNALSTLGFPPSPIWCHFSTVIFFKKERQLLQCQPLYGGGGGGGSSGVPKILIYQQLTRHHQRSKWMVFSAAGLLQIKPALVTKRNYYCLMHTVVF